MSRFSAGSFVCSAAALVGFVCASSWAVAQTAPARASSSASKPVRLHFDGPPSCREERAFLDALEARLQEVRLIPTKEEAVVQVQISKTAFGYQSSLSIQLSNGETLRRTLSARSCAEATLVIAFVASVALDPAARDPLELGEPELALEAQPERIGDEGTLGRSKSHRPHRWSVGASVDSKIGIAPQLMIGGRGQVGWQTVMPGLWAPSLRMALGASARRGYRTTDGTADFALYEAALQACPSRAQWGSVVLRPCLAGGGGALRATGRETLDARASTRPWIWSGAALLLGVRLHSHLNLTLGAEMGFPWIRDRFLFRGREFHAISAAFGSAKVGIEVFFGDRTPEVVH